MKLATTRGGGRHEAWCTLSALGSSPPHSTLELLRTLFLDTLSPGTLRGGSVSGLSRLNVSEEFVEKEALGFGYPPRPMR